MNIKTTIMLLLVCAGVFAYLFLVVNPWAPEVVEPEKASTDGTPILDPKLEKIDRIELTRRGDDPFVFVLDAADEWNLESPLKAPATKFEVDALKDAVAGIHYVKEYAASAKDRPGEKVTGLDKPMATVKLTADGKVVLDARIGNRLPTGTGNYLQLAGADTVYVSKKDLKAPLSKRLDAYRNKRVMKFDMNDVKRVNVEGVQNFELVRNEDQSWVIEKPLRGRADKSQAEGVARTLSNLYVQSFKDDKPISLKAYGLEPPQLTVTVETLEEIPPKAKPGSPGTQPADTQPSMETVNYVLMVGGATDPKSEAFFARLGDSPWVFAIRNDTYKKLASAPGQLLDKSIAEVDTAKVKTITAQTPGGAMTLTMDSDQNWLFADGSEAEAALVDDLLRAVRDLKATEYLVTSDTSLMTLDWSKPRAQVALTVEGELNPVTVLVGPASASGRMVYVRNAAEEAVAVVHEDAVAQLLQPPLAYRDRTVMKFQQDRVEHIEITRADAPTVRLAMKDSRWQMVSPIVAKTDRIAARNLVQDLSSLSAQRIVGTANKSAYGLDEPQVSVTVQIKPVAALPGAKVVGEEKAAAPAATDTLAEIDRDIEAIKKMLEHQKNNPDAKPEVTKILEDRLARKIASTQPMTMPSAETVETAERDIEVLEQMLEYQKQHPDKENLLATEMVKELLAKRQTATKPVVASPEDVKAGIIERDIKMIEQMLDAQKGNPNAKPEVTKMLEDRLVQKKAELAGIKAPSQPEVKSLPMHVLRLDLAQKDGKTYAAVTGSETVFELDNKIFEDVSAEMHERQILQFATNEVSEVAFQTAVAKITLRKTGDEWKYMEDPIVPIDAKKVTDVCSAFRDVKASRYVDYDAKDLMPYGLAGEVDRMAITLEGRQRVEIVLSKKGPAGDPDHSRYAMVAGISKVFLLKGDMADKFQQKLKDFEQGSSGQAVPATPRMPPGARPMPNMPGGMR